MKILRALFGIALVSCGAAKEATRTPEPVAETRAQVTPATLNAPQAPATRSEKIEETQFGKKIQDPYRWLEGEKLPEVKKWMLEQDKFARQNLAEMPKRAELEDRFKALFYVDSTSAPVRRGKNFFYVKTHADKEKAILYWKAGEKGKEKVLLDPNAWSADGTVSLGMWIPSWDGKKVAFSKKPNAADEAILHVVDVETGKISEKDVIAGAKYATPNWTPDDKGFYYEWLPVDSKIPVAERPGYTEIRFHKLGTDPSSDSVIHPRTGDPGTFLTGSLSQDGKYLFAYIHRGWTETSVFVKRLGKDAAFLPMILGTNATYEITAWKDQFYILTDEGAPMKRVFKVAANKFERAQWKELIPEDKGASLDGMGIYGGQVALHYLRKAVSQIKIASLTGKPVREVPLPTLSTLSGMTGLPDQEDAYVQLSSFAVPKQVYKTSLKSGKTDIWAKTELPLDPSHYSVEQVSYPSKDGTSISMFLVRRKDNTRQNAPTLLYGYGGFDVSLTPSFRPSIIPWLDNGGVFAVANLRGGGEYGRAWHEGGRLHTKQNVFDDFIAAAEYLIREKVTSPQKLGIWGGSNGGLLVGAAMTQRPELFGAVICAVPLLDMVRFHKFGSGRTWVPEYGNPEVEADFKVLAAYSPYHRVKPDTRYPPLLMMSADTDDRVDPMHARKFVAAVQNAGPNIALLRIEQNSGHSGADQVRKGIAYSVDQFAFLFRYLSGNTAETWTNSATPSGLGAN